MPHQRNPTRAPIRIPTIVPITTSRFTGAPLLLPGPELQVFVRCGVGVAGDQAEPRLLDPRADAVQERELPDRHEDRLLVHELLDLHELEKAIFVPVWQLACPAAHAVREREPAER